MTDATPETLARGCAILEALAAIDSVGRASNPPFIARIEADLAEAGAASRRIDWEPGVTTNLLATLGPADRRGLVLSGHADAAPVDDQVWTADPFQPAQRVGRLYGRGTAEKGFSGFCWRRRRR